jgi:probable DNA metabolism protein
MPDSKPLARPTNTIYLYDGSFEGFLCCVFVSVREKELPLNILPETAAPTLFETRFILSDAEKAEGVRASIPKKISPRAWELVTTVFCSCLADKELHLIKFLLKGYREGGKICNMLGDEVVAPLLAAERRLLGEAHLLKGFVRFADAGGALVAAITPKNYVLPFIARHFTLRFPREQFMIFDKTHKAALIHQNGEAEIISVDDVDFPEISEEEARYQELWKRFYNTIAIKGRENPRCRMTHMPKRYWQNMLEVSDLVNPDKEYER